MPDPCSSGDLRVAGRHRRPHPARSEARRRGRADTGTKGHNSQSNGGPRRACQGPDRLRQDHRVHRAHPAEGHRRAARTSRHTALRGPECRLRTAPARAWISFTLVAPPPGSHTSASLRHTTCPSPPTHSNLQRAEAPCVKALVLVPTKELCHQAAKVFADLTYYFCGAVKVLAVAGDASIPSQR